jgi:hypothetical protein
MNNTKRYIRLHFMFLLIAVGVSVFVNYILLNVKHLTTLIVGFVAQKTSILICLKKSFKERKKNKSNSCFLSFNSHYCNTYTSHKSLINLNKIVNFYSKAKQQFTSLIEFRQNINFYIPLHSGSFLSYVIHINLA